MSRHNTDTNRKTASTKLNQATKQKKKTQKSIIMPNFKIMN